MEKDEKAIKLLKIYCDWNNPLKKRFLTQEEIDYCIEKGVMYNPLNLMHDEVIDEIKELAEKIDMKDAVNSFLYSLSSGDNRYRTILSSVIWGRSLPRHKAVIEKEFLGNTCRICSLIMRENSEQCDTNLNGYSRYRHYSGQLDICEAGYVLLDLREFRELPKVKYCDEDIEILNRIFGLAAELGSENKAIALQKLITAEKFFKATKNEIYSIMGVLSICGVFDTPRERSVATEFVPNYLRDFVIEWDFFYPLNHWKAKYGINYSAVNKIFGEVVRGKLDIENTLFGEVQRKPVKEVKKSKAEQFFTEGKHSIELKNEYRHYYGLRELSPKWDKVTRFSTTHIWQKRSEIYFEGDVVKKIIYEETAEGNDFYHYQEIDLEVKTENRELIIPKTSRGRKQKLTPSLLMTYTYMNRYLCVTVSKNSDEEQRIYFYDRANKHIVDLPKARISCDADFQEYTKKYIEGIMKR